MPEINLRDGTADDIGAMYGLDLLCFDDPFRFDLGSMRRYATHPKAIVVVAEVDGGMCGFIVVNPGRRQALRAAYVTTLDVHPEYRRQVIARSLLVEAERRAAATGAVAMQLHVFAGNLGAIQFYAAAGYEQILLTPDFYAPGLDAWLLAKSL